MILLKKKSTNSDDEKNDFHDLFKTTYDIKYCFINGNSSSEIKDLLSFLIEKKFDFVLKLISSQQLETNSFKHDSLFELNKETFSFQKNKVNFIDLKQNEITASMLNKIKKLFISMSKEISQEEETYFMIVNYLSTSEYDVNQSIFELNKEIFPTLNDNSKMILNNLNSNEEEPNMPWIRESLDNNDRDKIKIRNFQKSVFYSSKNGTQHLDRLNSIKEDEIMDQFKRNSLHIAAIIIEVVGFGLRKKLESAILKTSQIKDFFKCKEVLEKLNKLSNEKKIDNTYKKTILSAENTDNLDTTMCWIVFENLLDFKTTNLEEWKILNDLRKIRNDNFAHLVQLGCTITVKNKLIAAIKTDLKKLFESESPDKRRLIEDKMNTWIGKLNSKDIVVVDLKKYEKRLIDEISKDLTGCMSLMADIHKHYIDKQGESNAEVLNLLKKSENKFEDLKNLIELIDPTDFQSILTIQMSEFEHKLDDNNKTNLKILSRLNSLKPLNSEIKSKTINMNDLNEKFLNKKNDPIYFRILLLTKSQKSTSPYYDTKELAWAISSIHWHIIVDLDPDSENFKGLQKAIAENYEKKYISVLEKVPDSKEKRSLQDILNKIENRDMQSVQNGCSLFYILPFGSEKRGTYEKEEDIDVDDTYAIFKDFFSKCFEKIDHMKKILTNLLLNPFNEDCEGHLLEKNIIRIINKSYKKAAECIQKQAQPKTLFIILENIDNSSLENLFSIIVKEDKKNAAHTHFVFNTFEQIILNFSAFNSLQNEGGLVKYIPKANGDRLLLNNIEYSTYSDVFDIYDVDEGYLKTFDRELRRELTESFLKGKPIKPETIYLQDTTGYKTYVIRDIIKEIEKGVNNRINSSFRDDYVRIYHEASAGGSTVGSILLYKFKDKIPSVRLKNLHLNNIEKIVNGIDRLSQDSKLPVLVLIDLPNKNANSNLIEDLFKELNSRKLIKFIIVSVERISISFKKFLDANNYIIHSKVSEDEKEQFNELFIRHSQPADRKMPKDIKYVHLFGLFGFNGNIEIIDNFVINNLKSCSEPLKTVFYLASFVHIYANYSLSMYLCASIIEIRVDEIWDFFRKKVDKIELSTTNTTDELELISYFLYLDDIFLRPYHKSLGESLLKNISNTDSKKEQFEYFYKSLLSLRIFDQELTINMNDILLEFGSALFIIKSFHSLEKDDYFSNLITESEHVFGIGETTEYIKKVFFKYDAFKKDASEFIQRLGSVYARYVFFKKNEKLEGLEIMKKNVLNFNGKKRIKDVQKFTQTSNPEEIYDSDLVATYGNLVRHYLNQIKDTLTLDEVIKEVDESLYAFKLSSLKNVNNPVPIYGEILVRYRLLHYCFHNVCKKNKSKYTSFTISETTSKIIRDSEKCIMNNFATIQQLNETARDIFWVIPSMLRFRVEIKTDNLESDQLKENIRKNVPYLIHVHDSVIALCFPGKDKISWDDLEPKFIKAIIDLTEDILLSKKHENFYASNYLDYTLGFIYAQKYPDLAKEYYFDRLFEFYQKNIFESKENESSRHFLEIPLSHYFYGILLIVKAIQENHEEEKNKYFKNAEEHLTICRKMCDPHVKKIRKYNFRSQYRFHLTDGYGLKRLKPLRENEKPNDCKKSDLKVFTGYIKSYNNAYNAIYYATVNELKYIKIEGGDINSSNDISFLNAYFIKEGNKDFKPEEHKKDKERQFNIMLRLDNIYMVNLS
jgi:hypothetical protein